MISRPLDGPRRLAAADPAARAVVRIAVTGGGGFLGSRLVERLRANGHDPFVVRRRDYDLTAPEDVARMFNNYGPRQNPRYITGTIITQALERETIELGTLEPGRRRFSVSWIERSPQKPCSRPTVRMRSAQSPTETFLPWP